MALQDILKSISERLHSTATVRAVYGDPVTAGAKTIIPVARVRYGFGGGFGEGRTPANHDTPDGEYAEGGGGGGGGGVEVIPVGMIEITQEETRFVSFEDRARAIKVASIGLLLGAFLVWRLIKRLSK